MTKLGRTAKLLAVITLTVAGIVPIIGIRYSWSLSTPALACIGGLIVFLGLWIEKDADEEEKPEDKKDHLDNLTEHARAAKLRAGFGWRLLMFGIGVEILTSAGLAAYDVVESVKNDPQNQLVTDVTADVAFQISTGNPQEFVRFISPEQRAGLLLLQLKGTNIIRGMDTFQTLEARTMEARVGYGSGLPAGGATRYQMKFTLQPRLAMHPAPANIRVSQILNSIDFLDILVLRITNSAEIMGGHVELRINDSISKNFEITTQKPHFRPAGAFNNALEIIATNEAQ